MAYPAPTEIEALKGDANLTVIQQAGLNVAYDPGGQGYGSYAMKRGKTLAIVG